MSHHKSSPVLADRATAERVPPEAHQSSSPVTATVVRQPGQIERNRARFARQRRMVDLLLRFGTPVVFLLLWQYASTSGGLDRQFWPAPTDVARKLEETISSGFLTENLLATTERLMYGYVAGSLIGVAVGMLLGTLRLVRVALEPMISAFYTVPKLAIFPLLLLLFGIGDTPKIILTALATFFVVCISTIAAAVGIAPAMNEPLRSFGATRMQTFRHLTLPAVLPEIFVALRLGAGMSVLVLIGMEMIQGANGLGYVIWSSWQVFDTERMYVGIVTAAVFGVCFQSLIKLLGRLALPWAQRDS